MLHEFIRILKKRYDLHCIPNRICILDVKTVKTIRKFRKILNLQLICKEKF